MLSRNKACNLFSVDRFFIDRMTKSKAVPARVAASAKTKTQTLPPVAPTVITPWQGKPQEFPLNIQITYGAEIIPLGPAEREYLNHCGEGLSGWSIGGEIASMLRWHVNPNKSYLREGLERECTSEALELVEAAVQASGKGYDDVIDECIQGYLGGLAPVKKALTKAAGKGGAK